MSSRRGVTLIELLVAMIVGSVLVIAALTSQSALDRNLRSRAERSGAMATARGLAGTFAWELESLGADSISGPDLLSLASDGVAFRAHRGLFASCHLGVDSLVLASGRLGDWRARAPVPLRDSALLYLPSTPRGEGAWLAVPILGAPVATVCPSGERGEWFPTRLDPTALARFDAKLATAVRIFEVVGLRGYGSGSSWQVGLEGISSGSTLQPISGPIGGATGLGVVGWDRIGATTAAPFAVAGVDLTLVVAARREVAVGPGRVAPALDSTRLTIRFGNRP